MSAVNLNTIAQSIATFTGESQTVEQKDLKKAGLNGKQQAQALKYDINNNGLSPEEFVNYLNAQTTPYVITSPDGKYQIKNGKITKLRAGEDAIPSLLSLAEEIVLILQDLAPHTNINLKNYKNWHAKWFKKGEKKGVLRLDGGDFKESLAKLIGPLHIEESDITDAAIDAIFGNHDGKLDKNDLLTKKQFLERLKIAKKVFAVKKQLGETFAGFLQRKQIYFVSMPLLKKSFLSNQIMYLVLRSSTAKDRLKKHFLEIAGNAYIQLGKNDKEKSECQSKVQEIREALEEGTIDPTKLEIPEELQEILLYTYMADFERTCIQKDITIDEDIQWQDPKIMDAFVRGIFGGNFILGLDTILPQDEDGDFDETEITQEMIMKLGQRQLPLPEQTAIPTAPAK